MRAHLPDVVAIEQQIQLPRFQRDHRLVLAHSRPGKAGFVQALEPQHEAGAFPVKDPAPVPESCDIVHLSF